MQGGTDESGMGSFARACTDARCGGAGRSRGHPAARLAAAPTEDTVGDRTSHAFASPHSAARRRDCGPGFRPARKKRDEKGFVAAFELRGRLIGTIRLVPFGSGLAASESLPCLPAGQGDRHDAWEVGRLVLEEGYRCGPEALKRCLFLTLVHLVRTVRIANMYATCTPLLARLYRRFGFSVVARDAYMGEDGSYWLIHGTVPDVLVGLANDPAERELARGLLNDWRAAEV